MQAYCFSQADFCQLTHQAHSWKDNMIRNAQCMAVDRIFCLYQQHDSCVVRGIENAEPPKSLHIISALVFMQNCVFLIIKI